MLLGLSYQIKQILERWTNTFINKKSSFLRYFQLGYIQTLEVFFIMKSHIGPFIFNNNNNNNSSPICECHVHKCVVCPNDIQNKSGIVKKLTCNEGGIYVIQGACSDQYTGRTINYGNRGIEHFKKSKLTSIYDQE